MTNRAEVNANLVRAAGENGHTHERQGSSEVLGPDDARNGFTTAPRACRHLLAVARVAPDRGVDAPAGHDFAPHERGVLLVDFTIVELPRELLVRLVVFRHDHQ